MEGNIKDGIICSLHFVTAECWEEMEGLYRNLIQDLFIVFFLICICFVHVIK